MTGMPLMVGLESYAWKLTMLDNEIIAALRTVLLQGFDDLSLSVEVKQSFQPTQQGANTDPTIYIFKITDKRYGFLDRKSVWDENTLQETHTESQVYESTFQFSALVRQDPSDVASLTASDVANYAASIMQSDKTRESLQELGIGVLRVLDVRNPYFNDDRDQFEGSPNFDLVITYNRVIITQSPVIQSVEYNFNRV